MSSQSAHTRISTSCSGVGGSMQSNTVYTFGAVQATQTQSNLSLSSDAVQMMNDLAQDQMQYALELAHAEAAYGIAPAGTAFAPPNLPPRHG